MKKVFLTFALAVGILTVQAQSETKSESTQPTESTTDQKQDKDEKKPSATQGTSTSGSSTTGNSDDAESDDKQLQPATTPKDSTDSKLDPAEKKDEE